MNNYISKRIVCLEQFVLAVNVKQLNRGSIAAGDNGSEKQKQLHRPACRRENTV